MNAFESKTRGNTNLNELAKEFIGLTDWTLYAAFIGEGLIAKL